MTPKQAVHHEVILKLTKLQNGRMAVVATMPKSMALGDSVSYASTDGSFRVEFPDGSPFEPPAPREITDNNIFKVAKRGTFEARCFITSANGVEVGWSPDNPESGTALDVRP